MKLIDAAMHNPQEMDELDTDIIGDAQVYVVNEAAEAVFQDRHRWEWPNSFPCVTPPFENMWVEYNLPAINHNKLFGVTATWGWHLFSFDLQNKMVQAVMETDHSYSHYFKTLRERYFDEAKRLGYRWVITAGAYCGLPEQRYFQLSGSVKLVTYVKDDGEPYKEVMIDIRSDYAAALEKSAIVKVDELKDIVWDNSFPLWLALSVLNCSNVVTIEETPAYTRAMRRRNEPPHLKYRMLHLRPLAPRTVRVRDGQSQIERLTPYHLVAGGYRDYRRGNGLFGRIKGRYWWKPQERGTFRAGTVIQERVLHLDEGVR